MVSISLPSQMSCLSLLSLFSTADSIPLFFILFVLSNVISFTESLCPQMLSNAVSLSFLSNLPRV